VEDKVEQIFRDFERRTADIRFSISSIQNEAAAMALCWVLPRKPRQRFQVVPSPDPIAVPSLFVPFLSDVSYAKKCTAFNYCVWEIIQKTVAGRDVAFSRVPRSCPSYVSRPFVEGYPLFDFIQSCNPQFGVFRQFFNVAIPYGDVNIACVLIQTDVCFFAVMDTAWTEGLVVLREPSTALIPNAFMDAWVARSWGSASLSLLTSCFNSQSTRSSFVRLPGNSYYSASFSSELRGVLVNGDNLEPYILKTFTATWKKSRISTDLDLDCKSQYQVFA
jgi:hypothetical protein